LNDIRISDFNYAVYNSKYYNYFKNNKINKTNITKMNIAQKTQMEEKIIAIQALNCKRLGRLRKTDPVEYNKISHV
jgi:hypothetical protein